MKCPNCGTKVNATDDFCENCGAVLNVVKAGSPLIGSAPVAKAATSVAAPVTCSNCGTLSRSGDEFCENCGAQLSGGSASGKPVSTPVSANNGQNGSSGTSGKRISGRVSKPITKCPSCSSPINDGDRFCRKCGFNFVGSGLVTSSKISTNSPHFANQNEQGEVELREGMMLGDNGKYRITKMIGKGGMGAVFLADDTILKRSVVIKALLHSDDPDAVAASIKEREFLAAVKHPSIVNIYDFFTVGTEGYIVMEFVNGRTLYQIMEKQARPFDPATAVSYILDVMPAFTYLHKLNLVYCDFKPQNAMLEDLKDGSKAIKLIDLGTVIRFEPNPDAVYGTTGFYAPEAVDHPSPQTDLYTICRALAWMVTWMDLNKPQYGMPPIDAFPVFSAYEPLYNLLCRGTHSDPTRRFQTAQELTDQLLGVLRIIEGGKPGMPVRSKVFNSGSLYQSNRLDQEGYSVLDDADPALDLLRQGDMAMLRGDLPGAEIIYNQAIALNRNSVDAYLRQAELLIEQQRFGDSSTQLAYAANRAPDNWKVKWLTGRLLEAQGNFAAARDAYKEVAKQLPGELPPQLALARVMAQLGDARSSLSSYNLVIKADPDSNDAIFGACQVLVKQNNFDEAVRILERVSEHSSMFVDARILLSKILLYQKPNATLDDLQLVSQSIRRLSQLGVETPDFLLTQANFYRRVMELSVAGKLPGPFPLPYQQLGAATGNSMPSKRTLGKLAEDNFRAYLKRYPNAPDREEIVRAKFRVSPWRIF